MTYHKNETVLDKNKDETNIFTHSWLYCRTPKCYSFNHWTVDDVNKKKNKNTLNGVSKVVVTNEIKHDDYINTMNKHERMKTNLVALSSHNHQKRTIQKLKH